jgi:hypothetical protein
VTIEARTEDFDPEATFAHFSKEVDEKGPEAAAAMEGGTDGDAGNAADADGTDAGAEAAAGEAAATESGESGVGAAEAAAGEADTGAGAEAAAEAKPDPDADAILQRLSKLVREAPAEEAPAAQTAATEEAPLFNDEERGVLEAYEKDWSDVSKAEELKRRAFGRDLLTYAFNEIAKEFKPLKDLTEALANRAHFVDLKDKVGDIDDTLYTQVDGWVGKQPAYLQLAYKQVLSNGTVDEVADLVDRFRKETGSAATPKKAPAGGGNELSEEAKKAAASLAPVGTKRTVITQQDDPSDTDAAWKRYTDMFDT